MPRDALFDLAVNRALSYATKLKLDLKDSSNLAKALEPWYTQTRFAYRVPLATVCTVLRTYPDEGFWQGGETGSWHLGKNPAP